MVELSDLGHINALNGEKQTILEAIAAFNAGHPIASLTIDDITIPTSDMPFPPQMVDAIRGHLQTRLNTIQQELTSLGVTGVVDAAPQRARVTPPPTRAAPPRPARPVRPAPAPAPPPQPTPPPRVPPRPGRLMPRR